MPSPVRVLQLITELAPGGAERVVAELARRLPAHGFLPTVVCLEDETAPLGRELAEAGLSSPVQGQILGENARQLLGLR